jgi:hypothetical protein
MFLKLYQRYSQYGPSVRELADLSAIDLAKLAVLLDKFSFDKDANEIKAMLEQAMIVLYES